MYAYLEVFVNGILWVLHGFTHPWKPDTWGSFYIIPDWVYHMWQFHTVPIFYLSEYDLLVGGIPTPLKNMTSSVGMIIPNIWKNKCSKPPTSLKFPLNSPFLHGPRIIPTCSNLCRSSSPSAQLSPKASGRRLRFMEIRYQGCNKQHKWLIGA